MHERRIATAAVRRILTCWLHSLAHSRFRCSCSATRTTEQDTDEGRQGHTLAHTVMNERRIATAAVRSILTCWLHSLAHSRFRCSCSATRTTEQRRVGEGCVHTFGHRWQPENRTEKACV